MATAGAGNGTFTVHGFDGGGYTLSWNVTYSGFTGSGAHLHAAWAGSMGLPAVTLTLTASPLSGSAEITPSTAQSIAEGRTYVDIHSAPNPAGEIRGQLLRAGEVLWSSDMSGGQEEPAVTTSASGGFGIIVKPDGGAAYEGTWTNLTATQAHIHIGGPGGNGSVVQALMLTGGSTGVAGTCANPFGGVNDGGFYVNAHSAANGAGEIRGNLKKNP